MSRLRLALLGCNGSIGKQTIQVVRALRGQIDLVAISTFSDEDALFLLAREFDCACIGIVQPPKKQQLQSLPCEIYVGKNANAQICRREDVDMVLIAVSGMEGVFALLRAIESKKKIALANKESIVCAGELVNAALAQFGGTILPVDSEHSAIFQCLQGIQKSELDSLTLTASGGPFWTFTPEQLQAVTLKQALHHPNWSMGAKITVDSATFANKGLEVIEAHFLFGLPAKKIDVLVHEQSIVHSMIHTLDGATLAQLGAPDMRLPISYALTYPNRRTGIAKKLDFSKVRALTFAPPDHARFPALKLAYDALKEGGTATAIYNAANEQAVELFMQKRISYNDIAQCIQAALDGVKAQKCDSMDAVLHADAQARARVKELTCK